MDRKIIPVSHAQLTSFDLDAFVRQAEALNQRNRERFTSPFPKRSRRWISHYQFQPHPIACTDQGAIEGGFSSLVGVTLDFSFARDLSAPSHERGLVTAAKSTRSNMFTLRGHTTSSLTMSSY